jgi:hypothetical protein
MWAWPIRRGWYWKPKDNQPWNRGLVKPALGYDLQEQPSDEHSDICDCHHWRSESTAALSWA